MAQSLSAVYLHLIFSTKNRNPYLADKELQSRLHSYIGGIVNGMKCSSLVVGGVEDHVHILMRQTRTETIAKVISTVKSNSSSWVKTVGGPPSFEWQSGYGAFSVGIREIDMIRNYIERQEEHHRGVSFQTEYRRMLVEHAIEFDEAYVWD